MKFLRKRFVTRTLSVLFLTIFLQSAVFPYYAYALMGGAHQPEFTSYEPASGSNDLVNLITGDMSFKLPVLEVPGPEGPFGVPLSYHAGIGPEQEASWCGLGFNMNAGSIVRKVNQYPDDAIRDPNNITVQNLTGISSWTRKFNHPFTDDWNSLNGYHGNINLLNIVEVDFGNRSDVGIAGIHVADEGVYFNAVQFATTVGTILSFGALGGAGGVAGEMGMGATIATYTVNAGQATALSFVMPTNTPYPSTWAGDYMTSESSHTSYEWHEKASRYSGVPIISKTESQHVWLDESRTELMHGVLYLGLDNAELINKTSRAAFSINNATASTTVPAINYGQAATGGSSDINFYADNTQSYEDQNSAITLATDSYTVNSAMVGGSISPYRLDIGSVSMPRAMTPAHLRLYPVPFGTGIKTPFVYDGQIANRYFNHVGADYTANTDPASPAFYYGIQYVKNGSAETAKLNDIIYKSDKRIRSDLNTVHKVLQGNNIEWLTNQEVLDGVTSSTPTYGSRFIDFLSAAADLSGDKTKSDRFKFRTFNNLRGTPSMLTAQISNFQPTITLSTTNANGAFIGQLSVGDPIVITVSSATQPAIDITTWVESKTTYSVTLGLAAEMTPYRNSPATVVFKYYPTQLLKGIGGYGITSADGTTFHFALPVMAHSEYSESQRITDPQNIKTTTTRPGAYATTWLLTAITGSDFIDRNFNGLADDGDWGYWVKMNYGKHTDNYQWRTPFSGTIPDEKSIFQSFEQGTKQLYYLNTIETRSHVAMFMKSSRQDGKATNLTAPLQLDEICLLKKEHYKNLTNTYSKPEFSNKIDNVCLSSDFTTTGVRDFINKNCVKRVLFTYDYSLCPGTLNAGGSNNPSQGKLTLKRVSIRGRNDLKVVPDYIFSYDGPNPSYNAAKWDGWGMYSASGSRQNVDGVSSTGSEWSLTKITTPLGGEISFSYERDVYSTVSGLPAEKSVTGDFNNEGGPSFTYLGPDYPTFTTLYMSDPSAFSVGDRIKVKGSISYTCPNGNPPPMEFTAPELEIVGKSGNILTLNSNYVSLDVSSCTGLQQGDNMSITFNAGTITKLRNKFGGNLRVKSMAVRDQFGRENKLRYVYNEPDGFSSGDVSQEPIYIRNFDFPFYRYLKYPQTPVLYKRVTVLSGRLSTEADYSSKEVFEFETASTATVTLDDENKTVYPEIHQHHFKIRDWSSKIGRLNAVRIYDKNNSLVSESVLTYTDQLTNDSGVANQGVFTEGTLLTEMLSTKYKLNRTTVITYPNALKKVTNSKDGLSSTTETLRWDLLTGHATQRLSKSPMGIYIKTVSKPAYTVPEYEELGSKGYNGNYRNMMSQIAANYVYRSDAAGNSLSLIEGSAQTWSKTWNNYRYLNGSQYVESPGEPESNARPVWRPSKSYVWKGTYARMLADGSSTFSSSDEFNFTVGATNTLWQDVGGVTRYDHFSKPIESTDMTGIKSAIKMGYDDRTAVAIASNATYHEIAFSSAEDQNTTTGYFSGEVAVKNASGNAVVVKKSSGTPGVDAHTGDCAVSLSTGYGFVYKPVSLRVNRVYRLMAWANSTNGRIYYKLNGGAEVTSATPVRQGKTGWYLIKMDIPAFSTFTSLEVGVKSASGTVLFDDFRFQPLDAAMVAYVNNPSDFQYTSSTGDYTFSTYILGEDNLYTRYQSSPDGLNTKVFVESTLYQGEKLVSENTQDFRRFHKDQ